MRADARAESSAERKAVALAFVARPGRAHDANYARSRTTCLRGPGRRSSLLIAATAARGPVPSPAEQRERCRQCFGRAIGQPQLRDAAARQDPPPRIRRGPRRALGGLGDFWWRQRTG